MDAEKKVDPLTGAVYMRRTGAEVAYTKEIAPGVMADYDDRDDVRGLEIIEPSLAAKADWDQLLVKAQAQRGKPVRVTRRAG